MRKRIRILPFQVVCIPLHNAASRNAVKNGAAACKNCSARTDASSTAAASTFWTAADAASTAAARSETRKSTLTGGVAGITAAGNPTAGGIRCLQSVFADISVEEPQTPKKSAPQKQKPLRRPIRQNRKTSSKMPPVRDARAMPQMSAPTKPAAEPQQAEPTQPIPEPPKPVEPQATAESATVSPELLQQVATMVQQDATGKATLTPELLQKIVAMAQQQTTANPVVSAVPESPAEPQAVPTPEPVAEPPAAPQKNLVRLVRSGEHRKCQCRQLLQSQCSSRFLNQNRSPNQSQQLHRHLSQRQCSGR